MAVPGAIRIVCSWEFGTFPWAQQVFHARVTSAGTVDQGTADQVATIWGQTLSNIHAPNTGSLTALMVSTWLPNLVTVQDIRVDGLDEFSAIPTISGLLAGDPMPPETALAFRLRTEPGAGNGRTFMPGWGEQSNGAEGRPSLAAEQRPIPALEFWRTELQTVPGIVALAVVNRQRNLVVLDPPQLSDVGSVGRTASSQSRGWQRQDKRKDGIQVI